MKNAIAYNGLIKLRETPTINRLESASLWVRLKQFVSTLVVSAIIGGIVFVIGFLFQWEWLKYTGYVVGGLLSLYGFSSLFTAKVSTCPYCEGLIGKGAYDSISAKNENSQIECPTCNEWLISNHGEIRAYTLDDAKHEDEFDVPVLKDMVWPNECIACGNEVVHYENLRTNKLNAAKLIVGTISVSMAKIPDVPYCMHHKGLTKVKISNEEVRLVFSDYHMQRRYLQVNDANRGKILKAR